MKQKSTLFCGNTRKKLEVRIEYVIDEDGIAYCDFYKRTKVSDYKYEIGKIYDATLPREVDITYAR